MFLKYYRPTFLQKQRFQMFILQKKFLWLELLFIQWYVTQNLIKLNLKHLLLGVIDTVLTIHVQLLTNK